MDTLLVRLKARNPRAGLKAKDYSLRFNRPGSPSHLKWFDFKVAMVWHRVPEDVGEALRIKTQDPYRPSPLLFDVCTDKEAVALDRKAQVERERRQAIVNPTVATAVDLTGGMASRPAPPVSEPIHEVDLSDPMTDQESVGRGDMSTEDLGTPDVWESRRAAMAATRPPGASKALEGTSPVVATSGPPEGHQAPGRDAPTMSWKRSELADYAEGRGVKVTRNMVKADILAALGIDPE